ncbi:MAG: serpin family protein [Planctomycetota bacterium]|jgi:serpin B
MNDRRGLLSKVWAVLLVVAVAWSAGCGEGSPSAEGDDQTKVPAAAAPAVQLPETDDTPLETVAEASNAFAYRLYGAQAGSRREGNLVFSPPGLFLALMMAREGAAGQTREQFDEALQLSRLTDLSDRDVVAEFADLMTQLRAVGDGDYMGTGEATELNIVAGMWGQRGAVWQEAFVDTLTHDFGASPREVDFDDNAAAANDINEWVAEHTRGRIGPVLSPAAIDADTDMVLAYAVYATACWDDAFSTQNTGPDEFHVSDGETITVNMMKDIVDYRMGRVGRMKLLQKSCVGGLSAVFILPDTIDGLADAEAWLASGGLDEGLEAITQSSVRELSIYLPKLDLTTSVTLQDQLQAMGLVDAFQPNVADFSAAFGDPAVEPWMSMSRQVARVRIEETGFEGIAVGYLAFLHLGEDAEFDPSEFRADHPYLFVIRHDESGQILFIGRVVRPNEIEGED